MAVTNESRGCMHSRHDARAGLLLRRCTCTCTWPMRRVQSSQSSLQRTTRMIRACARAVGIAEPQTHAKTAAAEIREEEPAFRSFSTYVCRMGV